MNVIEERKEQDSHIIRVITITVTIDITITLLLLLYHSNYHYFTIIVTVPICKNIYWNWQESCSIVDFLSFQKVLYIYIVQVFAMCVASVHSVCVVQGRLLCCKNVEKRVKRIALMRVWYGHVCVFTFYENIKRGKRIIYIVKCLWNDIFFYCQLLREGAWHRWQEGVLCVLLQILNIWKTFLWPKHLWWG